MAGYVKGSKAHYNILRKNLLTISSNLFTEDMSPDKKKALYLKQVDILDQMEKHFPNGKPE